MQDYPSINPTGHVKYDHSRASPLGCDSKAFDENLLRKVICV